MKHEHTMNCQEILKYMNDYIDDELDQQLCAEIEAHLDACPDCQIVVNTLKKTIQICHAAAQETTLPQEVKKRLYARLDLESDVQKE